MFTYVCLGTNDVARACHFYDAVMATIGHQRCDVSGESDWEDWAGWGRYENKGQYELALWVCKPFNGKPATVGNGVMVAFRAPHRQAVRDFHAQALAHGGTCEGAPGLRPQYNDDFFAAYVRDPDGHKLAVVCRG